jgi:hypothetical protein
VVNHPGFPWKHCSHSHWPCNPLFVPPYQMPINPIPEPCFLHFTFVPAACHHQMQAHTKIACCCRYWLMPGIQLPPFVQFPPANITDDTNPTIAEFTAWYATLNTWGLGIWANLSVFNPAHRFSLQLVAASATNTGQPCKWKGSRITAPMPRPSSPSRLCCMLILPVMSRSRIRLDLCCFLRRMGLLTWKEKERNIL